MDKALEDIICQLEENSSTKIAGAVKTYPLRELLKSGHLIQDNLLNKENNVSSQKYDLQLAYDKLQEIITKRLKAAQKIIAKFSKTSPEVIALNTSVFSLVPSRDVLEDVRTTYGRSEELLNELTQASNNILEAVNIEIQQRFYGISPETIAVHYSGTELDSYRKLLKNLLTHIEVDSDIFKVYSTIIRNVTEGSKIHESWISVARKFCNQVFQTTPPDFEGVFNRYPLDELGTYHATIQETLNILEQDISERPSIITFSNQCRQIFDALSEHFINRRIQMRKTTRVLQLSHYTSFLNTESVSENATTSLMLCQVLFEEACTFLIKQQEHLDVALNIKSIEEAQQKIREGLRYRQFAIEQLFQEISKLSPDDLTFVSEKCLGDSNLLLQEIQHLVQDYIRRTPDTPQQHILDLANALRENIKKLHEAIATTRISPVDKNEPWEFEQTLPNLSKFHDKELVGLIHKALRVENSLFSVDDPEEPDELEALSVIPLDQLHDYIESFINIINIKKPGLISTDPGLNQS
jgi:hypothetical protein